MRALFTTAPGEFGLVERPDPQPGPDDVLVRVTRASICHTDVLIRAGGVHNVTYPVIQGHEFCGVVEGCGSRVSSLRSGDRVVAETILSCGVCSACKKGLTNWCENRDELGTKSDGGFAEYCVMPACHAIRMPDSLSYAAGAMVEPLANAVAALSQVAPRPGDRVVVIGPGPIGCLAVQVAKLCDPSVLALVGTRESRLSLGPRLGATHTVNVREEGASTQLREILEGKGADVIVECAGTVSAFEFALEHAAVLGRIGIEGVYGPDTPVTLHPHRTLTERSVRLIGITGWNRADFARALELLAGGDVVVEPLVTHTYPLSDWETAFDMATTRKDESIKVQLALGDG